MAAAVTETAANGKKRGLPAEDLDQPYLTYEEAEAALERMARVLAPANVDLRQLAETLSESVRQGNTPGPEVADDKELELRKAQVRYRALVEQIPAISFMAPLDGSVSELYVSPQIEQMLGYTAEEWLSNPILWYDRLHPEDKMRWQEDFAQTLNIGKHFRSDYRFLARDGRTVWVHGEAKVIADEEGRPLFLQGVAFDITERMEAEAKLQRNNNQLAQARDQAMEASRAKSAFLANMSHELRTPLHAILGFSEMLFEDATDGGHVSFLPDLEKITGSAKHLVGLINNILDLSKIEAGRMELYLEDFDLIAMIQDVLTTVLPLIEANGNELDLRCPDDLGMMHGDQTKVRQVLLNLLSNAAKFTENGTITLEAARTPGPDGDRIRLDVRDTGIGITPDQAEKLFKSFSQGDDSTTRKYGGTGLGLAISQRFCRMMGGRIIVASEHGMGSTFTMDLPVLVVPVDAEAEEKFEVRVADRGPGAGGELDPAVLVIEDDPQVVELMRRVLEREGLRIVTANQGPEGLRLARELHPVAIILDVSLPDLDGWAVLTALKDDRDLADIPVILCSYAADSGQVFTTGAADYLTKPIDWGRVSGLMKQFKGNKASARVLVVDDEADSRQVLVRMANQGGWTVSEAANGWVGLKAVGDDPPDLILLDLMMPEMDGFEFLRLLRATQTGRSIPVVVATAKELTASDRVRLNGSAQKILQKGTFSREELVEEVTTLVTARKPAPRARPATARIGNDGAADNGHLVRDLQAQLELVRAECNAAQAQLRTQAPPAATDPAGEDDRAELEAELHRTRQQLREQQQTVELLRTEMEENETDQEMVEQLRLEVRALWADRDAALAKLQAMPSTAELLRTEREANGIDQELVEELRLEVRTLRADRDAALAKLQAAPPASHPAAATADLVASLHRLEQEMEEVRQRQHELPPAKPKRQRQLVNGSRSGRQPPQGQEAEGRKRSALSQSAPKERTEEGPTWQVRYQDEDGQWYSRAATAEQIRRWCRKGDINVGQALVRRGTHGEFEPLIHFDEFTGLHGSLAQRARAGPTRVLPPVPEGTKFSEWATWGIAVVIAVVAAVITWEFRSR